MFQLTEGQTQGGHFQLHAEADLSGLGEPDVGGTIGRLLEAGQGFGPCHTTGSKVDDRLEDDLKALVGEGGADDALAIVQPLGRLGSLPLGQRTPGCPPVERSLGPSTGT